MRRFKRELRQNSIVPIPHIYSFTVRSVDAPYVLRLVIANQRNTILQSAP